MEFIPVPKLGGSLDPGPDVLMFQTPEGNMNYPRENQEGTMLWGALRRSGFQVGLISEEVFAADDLRGAQAIALSRSGAI